MSKFFSFKVQAPHDSHQEPYYAEIKDVLKRQPPKTPLPARPKNQSQTYEDPRFPSSRPQSEKYEEPRFSYEEPVFFASLPPNINHDCLPLKENMQATPKTHNQAVSPLQTHTSSLTNSVRYKTPPKPLPRQANEEPKSPNQDYQAQSKSRQIMAVLPNQVILQSATKKSENQSQASTVSNDCAQQNKNRMQSQKKQTNNDCLKFNDSQIQNEDCQNNKTATSIDSSCNTYLEPIIFLHLFNFYLEEKALLDLIDCIFLFYR